MTVARGAPLLRDVRPRARDRENGHRRSLGVQQPALVAVPERQERRRHRNVVELRRLGAAVVDPTRHHGRDVRARRHGDVHVLPAARRPPRRRDRLGSARGRRVHQPGRRRLRRQRAERQPLEGLARRRATRRRRKPRRLSRRVTPPAPAAPAAVPATPSTRESLPIHGFWPPFQKFQRRFASARQHCPRNHDAPALAR